MKQPRPPIVAILGHVDHGKTTLLDFIKKSRIAAGEHGQITQSIGAYEIDTGIKGYQTSKITFIDTPGHEAFTRLRARGATVADIALLIVDAKDSVMPQTIESISHIKAANIPYIVVLNKTDLPDAKPDKVKSDLAKQEVLVEGSGGKVPALPISAKTGKGVPELLESILLLASELNLTFDLQHEPQAYIIETKKDKRGVSVSCIMKDGKLTVGDEVFAENQKTKVRSLINDRGERIGEVLPSTPFELLGFAELPTVGSLVTSQSKDPKQEEVVVSKKPRLDLETLLHPDMGKKITMLIKADTQGSLEAIVNSLTKSQQLEIILKGVGEINKSDVFLAKTAGAIILGFNVKVESGVQDLAKQEKVIIKSYNIIYELIEEITEVATLLKEKEEAQKNLKGEAKVLATFIIHEEKVCGIKMTKGKATLGDSVELYRDAKLLGKGKVVSVQIRSKKVEEVKKDQEAGIMITPQLDIRASDVVKFVL